MYLTKDEKEPAAKPPDRTSPSNPEGQIISLVDRGGLVGRARETAELERLVQRAAEGHGQAVVVRGEPGMGKTCLVGMALAGCERLGFESYAAAAFEMEMRRPFGVIADALHLRRATDQRLSEIRDLLSSPTDEMTSVEPRREGVEFQLAERVLEYLEIHAARAPVVLALEDLQWADHASLMALGRFAREGAQLPLLLVCTLSPYPARPEVRSLLTALEKLGAGRLELSPLSEGEVEDLVRQLAGAPPGEELLRLVADANGNPFYVRELLSAMSAGGTLSMDPGGRAEAAPGNLPASLRQTVLHRLGGLPAPTVDVLRTASVLGQRFSVHELRAVLSRPVAGLVDSLQPAVDANILAGTEDGLAFRHRLVREAVYEGIPVALRRAQHREVAGALAGAGLPGERVAAHLVLGAQPGDTEAAGWLRDAARGMATRAPAISFELLERARDLYLPADPSRAEVLAEMVQPLAWTGRQEDLETLCRAALQGEGRAQDEMVFRMGLGHSLFIQGRIEEAHATYRQAAAPNSLSEDERVTLDVYAGLTGVYLGDLAPAKRLRPAALGQWPLAAGLARFATANAELNAGRARRALAMMDELATAGPSDRQRLDLFRGAALLELDRVEEARAVLREGARDCLVNGTAERAARHHYGLVAVEYVAGDLDAALAEHEAGLALAEGSGHHWRAASLGLAAAVAVHRGELERAERTIEEGEKSISSAGPNPCDDEVARARYLLARARGDWPAAKQAATEAWRRCADHGYRRHLTWFAVDLVRASLETRDLERARATLEEAEEVAKPLQVGCWGACAWWARGLLTGEPDPLLGAVSRLRGSPRRLYLALCLEDAAVALARAGRVADARSAAFEALEIFTGMDAVSDAARLTSRLRAAGIRLGSRARRGRPRYGWESLSASELSVVRLVAEGKTNRAVADQLFLSRDTVHTHVSHALRKLGLSSRVELAAEAARRGF